MNDIHCVYLVMYVRTRVRVCACVCTCLLLTYRTCTAMATVCVMHVVTHDAMRCDAMCSTSYSLSQAGDAVHEEVWQPEGFHARVLGTIIPAIHGGSYSSELALVSSLYLLRYRLIRKLFVVAICDL